MNERGVERYEGPLIVFFLAPAIALGFAVLYWLAFGIGDHRGPLGLRVWLLAAAVAALSCVTLARLGNKPLHRTIAWGVGGFAMSFLPYALILTWAVHQIDFGDD